jgi:virginiamycin B lyase
MHRPLPTTMLALAALTCTAIWAGGSNYGVTPGSRPDLRGAIDEWSVPTPKFARDPAPGPDGNIYITVMYGDRIARFNPNDKTFKEWDLPPGSHPHGLLVDHSGQVWYTGNGSGAIGRLDPATGKVTEFKAPSGGDPHTLVIDDKGVIWFTEQSGNRVGRLDTSTGKITEFKTSGNPYGIALDRRGHVWFCQMSAGMLGKLDPATGNITETDVGPGSMPRRMATAPDGSLWVTLYGAGKLIHVDTESGKVIKDYALPSGPNGGPYAVTVDGAGIVWANEIHTDSVVRLNPANGEIKVFNLPSKNVGIRKMSVDAQGRLWYMGSHNGRLGVIE